MECLNCKTIINKRSKYCSNKCQKDYQYKKYIKDWKKRTNRWKKRRISNIVIYKNIFI